MHLALSIVSTRQRQPEQTLTRNGNIIMTVSEHISQFLQLSTEEMQRIDEAFQPCTIAKGDVWVKQGTVCDQVAFVQRGKLRAFYVDETGNEVTCYFVTHDNFISSFTSFLTNTPTHENISAIEDSTLMIISKQDLERLSEEVPLMHVWRRIVAENLFIVMEKRIAMLQSQSASERYEKMLEENPDIVLSVPLQYTASFLGITPQHLSRLRRDLAR
jgi:CRP-like cAMP-binding protein